MSSKGKRGGVSVSCSVMSNSLRPHGLQPARSLCPWNSPVNNTGVGCHSLLQGVFLTQESNLGLSHCRQILYHLSHQGSPKGWRGVNEESGISGYKLLYIKYQINHRILWYSTETCIQYPIINHNGKERKNMYMYN